MAETGGSPSAATSSTSAKLFVRQSSGLVRNVSVTNALFFNVAAFVGVGLTLYPIFYSLADVTVWKIGPFSAYGWAAIVTGLFCILLALIFSSLTSVMPRSGGDYVFTSRIQHPFLGLAGVVDARHRLGPDHRLRGPARPAQPADHRADHRHRRRRLLGREQLVHRRDRTRSPACRASSASIVVLGSDRRRLRAADADLPQGRHRARRTTASPASC